MEHLDQTVINHFFNIGLCLLYDHILDYTKKLSDAQIESYELTGAFCQTHYENRYLR